MNEDQNGLERLVADVFAAGDDEIQCEEAKIVTARCAHALLSDEESRRQYPALWHHFRFCPDCAEEYRLVMYLAQLEADGQLKRPARIPPPPDEGRPAVWAHAADAVRALFPGFSPALAGALTRGADLAAEPVEVPLAEGRLHVTFDVAVNEQDEGLRDLFCTVSAADGTLQGALEGSPAWLQVGDDGPAVLEKALNELGDVTFSRLPPARYALRLLLAGEEYVVTSVVLP